MEARKALRRERQREVEEMARVVKEGMELDGDDDGDGDGEAVVRDEEEGDMDKERVSRASRPVRPHEEEYIDEDKYATVTIEEVQVSKDGLHALRNSDYEDDKDAAAPASASKKSKAPQTQARKDSERRGKKIATGDAKARKRKKKFRYESKTERSFAKNKQRLARKVKAEKRRGAS